MEKKLYKKPQVLSYEEFPEGEVLKGESFTNDGHGGPDVPIIPGDPPEDAEGAKPFSLWDDEDEDEDNEK